MQTWLRVSGSEGKGLRGESADQIERRQDVSVGEEEEGRGRGGLEVGAPR